MHFKSFSFILLIFGLGVLGHAPFASGREPTPDEKRRLITEKDIEDIDVLKKMAKAKFDSSAKAGQTALRDAHAKHHGCVRVNFQVLNDLALELRVGAFAYKDKITPPKYKGFVRFSNGGKFHDYLPDGRGAAIQVYGVEGERMVLPNDIARTSQDWPMINFPQFFVKNAGEYKEFFTNPGEFFAKRPVERGIAQKTAGQFMTSPLESAYFSQVPVRFGRRFMRYRLVPCERRETLQVGNLDLRDLKRLYERFPTPAQIEANEAEFRPYSEYLRLALSAQLMERDACFYFEAQFRENDEPLNDPTQGWNSAFHRLARVDIPRIELPIPPSTDRRSPWNQFCENLELSPAHGLMAHEHVGSVQEARREIYRMISEARHAHNGAPLREPTGDEPLGMRPKR